MVVPPTPIETLPRIGNEVAIVHTSGTRIGDIIKKKSSEKNVDSIIYSVPCGQVGCQKEYIGETCRGFKTRMYEHKQDLKWDRQHNALVQHRTATGHMPDFTKAATLQSNMTKMERKFKESLFISARNTVNVQRVSHRVAGIVAKAIVT